MAAILDIISWVLLITGSFFVIIGAIGLLRLPDFYTRVHAASITDTVGAWLILLGLLLQVEHTMVGIKVVFILIFLFLTSPLASHALTKAAYYRDTPMVRDGDDRPGGEA
ncbi:monovalent cation/H(+) antiporter subunit G [Gemmatimonadota bacterium]